MTRNTHDRKLDHFGFDLDTNLKVNGAIGGSISDGDTIHAALTALDAAFGASTAIGVRIGRDFMTIASECFYNSTGLYEGCVSTVSGSGAATSASTQTGVNHPGAVQLSTGTTGTGKAAIIADVASIFLGGGATKFLVVFKIDTLSDGTQTYTVRLGLGDSASAEPTDGIYFRYTHSVNGGKWQRISRAGGSETANDTGVTADTGWHTFEAEINALGTLVEYYIDGLTAGSQTANIPTGATAPMPAAIIKSAGGTARTFHLDAFAYTQEFATQR